MFLKKSISTNGRIYLSIIEGYRQDGKVKQRTIKKLGFLDDLSKEYDDPIAHFSHLAKTMTTQTHDETHLSIDINTNDPISDGYNLYNVGYGILNLFIIKLTLQPFSKLKT